MYKKINRAFHALPPKLRTLYKYSLTPIGIFVIGGLIGFLAFWYLFGLRVVDPQFTDWLFTKDDLYQHYVGWQFFRQSSWQFPVGVISQLAHPFGLPVTYMDSIPLAAIFFKVLSPILPHTFQYLGAWGLLSYVLQGSFGALIVRKMTKNIGVIMLAAGFFVLSPILLQREFLHTALASHWIILMAIWWLMDRREKIPLRFHIAWWSCVMVLAVLVHPYLFAMIGFLLAVWVVRYSKKIVEVALSILIPVASGVFVFWIIGGFSTSDATGGGLGLYSLNINSFMNPLGWSSQVLNKEGGVMESFSYLGLGMMIILTVGLFGLAEKRHQLLLRGWINQIGRFRAALIILLGLLLTLAALSPVIKLASHVIIDIKLPHEVIRVWSVFRSSARLIWPLYYALYVVGFWLFITWNRRRYSGWALALVLAVCLGVQFVDVVRSHSAKNKIAVLHNSPAHTPYLNLERWGQFTDGKKHLVYLGDALDIKQSFYEFSEMAVNYRLSVNDGYFARRPDTKVQAYTQKQISLLQEHKADMQNNLYIASRAEIFTPILRRHNYTVTKVDDLYVLSDKSTN